MPSRVHVWGYPWDVAVWGPEGTADLLAELGVDGLSLAVVYHEAQVLSFADAEPRIVRPLAGVPMWRARAEDLPGALRGVAFQPFLEALRVALTSRGIALRAWSVVFHDAALAPIENAFGQTLRHAPCPIANAAALPALASDLRALGVFDAAEFESAGNVGAFHGGHHDIAGIVLSPFWQVVLGLCLCPACRDLAAKNGVDPGAVQSALVAAARTGLSPDGAPADGDAALDALCAAHPEIVSYANVRAEAVLENVKRAQAAFGGITAIVGSGNVSADRLPLMAAVRPTPPPSEGFEILSLAYGEPAAGQADLRRLRELGWPADRHIVGQTLVEGAVRDRGVAEARLEAALAAGARRLSFYNIGILPPGRRAWLKDFSRRIRQADSAAPAPAQRS